MFNYLFLSSLLKPPQFIHENVNCFQNTKLNLPYYNHFSAFEDFSQLQTVLHMNSKPPREKKKRVFYSVTA